MAYYLLFLIPLTIGGTKIDSLIFIYANEFVSGVSAVVNKANSHRSSFQFQKADEKRN
jgi:hypothetical protein